MAASQSAGDSCAVTAGDSRQAANRMRHAAVGKQCGGPRPERHRVFAHCNGGDTPHHAALGQARPGCAYHAPPNRPYMPPVALLQVSDTQLQPAAVPMMFWKAQWQYPASVHVNVKLHCHLYEQAAKPLLSIGIALRAAAPLLRRRWLCFWLRSCAPRAGAAGAAVRTGMVNINGCLHVDKANDCAASERSDSAGLESDWHADGVPLYMETCASSRWMLSWRTELAGGRT
jgi:hypothetical protein